jgi:hypothetical protein
MAAWKDVEQAEPEFAARVRRLFDAGRHKTIATLCGGHLGLIIGGAELDRGQRRGPRVAARLQGGDRRVRPARDHLRVALPRP